MCFDDDCEMDAPVEILRDEVDDVIEYTLPDEEEIVASEIAPIISTRKLVYVAHRKPLYGEANSAAPIMINSIVKKKMNTIGVTSNSAAVSFDTLKTGLRGKKAYKIKVTSNETRPRTSSSVFPFVERVQTPSELKKLRARARARPATVAAEQAGETVSRIDRFIKNSLDTAAAPEEEGFKDSLDLDNMHQHLDEAPADVFNQISALREELASRDSLTPMVLPSLPEGEMLKDEDDPFLIHEDSVEFPLSPA